MFSHIDQNMSGPEIPRRELRLHRAVHDVVHTVSQPETAQEAADGRSVASSSPAWAWRARSASASRTSGTRCSPAAAPCGGSRPSTPRAFDCQVGGEIDALQVADYVPKSYRKSTKVMARDIEIAVAAAYEAVKDAGLRTKCLIERGEAAGAAEPRPDPLRRQHRRGPDLRRPGRTGRGVWHRRGRERRVQHPQVGHARA